MELHSFDRSIGRPAPSALVGVDSVGAPVEIVFRRRTIVIAVKPNCDGCREFLGGSLSEFDGLDVVLVSATAMDDNATPRTNPVVLATDWIKEFLMMAAPSYMVIDPAHGRVLIEGVAFSSPQIAAEIVHHLV